MNAAYYKLLDDVKEALEGEQFDDDATSQFVRNWLMNRSTTFFEEGIKKLPIRWRKCISVKRNYV